MVTGVYEFHPPYGVEHLPLGRSYAEIVTKYFAVYSIVKGARRPANLHLQLNFDKSMVVPYCIDIYEYLTSILMDNAWKYSVTDTTISVTVNQKSDSRADISFSNVSTPIPKELNIFAKGTKGNQETEGFGYGLHWATILVDHYNRQVKRTTDFLEITHAQFPRDDGLAEQIFTLVNADMRRQE
jgi:K+-sensing histidine kinase KdpD